MTLLSDPAGVRAAIADSGFAWVPRSGWSLGPRWEDHWPRLAADWDKLEPDRYLADGARFRLRRYGRFTWAPAAGELSPLPDEPYFQPAEENAYAGGIARSFPPLLPHMASDPFVHALVRATFDCLPIDDAPRPSAWEVRVHQIRIVATPGEPGLPTPEGVHQDGTDFLTLHLVRRHNIAGAESTIYDLARRPVRSLTLREPMDSMILEDPRVFHGVTPARSADGLTTGTRDLLGIDFIRLPGGRA